jgi:hypothetical protein
MGPHCWGNEMSELSVGTVWNKLTLIKEPFKVEGRNARYITVRCECDREFEMAIYTFKFGHGKGACRSCACAKPDAPMNAWIHRYRVNARNKGRKFELTREEFESLVSSPCHYCGEPPSLRNVSTATKVPLNGIDRLDSSGGYLPENVVTCCSICNNMKGTMSYADFIDRCSRISGYNNG